MEQNSIYIHLQIMYNRKILEKTRKTKSYLLSTYTMYNAKSDTKNNRHLCFVFITRNIAYIALYLSCISADSYFTRGIYKIQTRSHDGSPFSISDSFVSPFDKNGWIWSDWNSSDDNFQLRMVFLLLYLQMAHSHGVVWIPYTYFLAISPSTLSDFIKRLKLIFSVSTILRK